jgi:hypothetical protein
MTFKQIVGGGGGISFSKLKDRLLRAILKCPHSGKFSDLITKVSNIPTKTLLVVQILTAVAL